MDKKTKAGSTNAEVTLKVVALLESLSSDDRHKIIDASLTLLGDTPRGAARGSETSGLSRQEANRASRVDQNQGDLPAKAQHWIKKYELTVTQLEEVFHITSEGVSVIASEVPGATDKEKTHNAYILLGLSRLLVTGDDTFDDKAARTLCEGLGCYDSTNHSGYMSKKGNILSGSKKTGWKLTAPGLKRGAELVAQLTKEE